MNERDKRDPRDQTDPSEFVPFDYGPKGSAESAIADSSGTATSRSASSGGAIVTVSRDIRLSTDMLLVDAGDFGDGSRKTIQEAFLCFPGSARAQQLVLMLALAPLLPVRADPSFSTARALPFTLPSEQTFKVRVVQRPASGPDKIIYPDTSYSVITGKPDFVDPQSAIASQEPVFLVVEGGFRFEDGAIPFPKWSGPKDPPLVPIVISPLRLHVTMNLLVNRVL